jgi:hypothetical protein
MINVNVLNSDVSLKTTYLLCIDTETGGLPDDVSLLTAYFGFFKLQNKNLEFVDELDLLIKPIDGVYKITSESIMINKIDLVQHDRLAINQKEAGTKLYNKLSDWQKLANNEKIVPVGHNIGFDINKITKNLISSGSWNNFVSYRVLDTSTIVQFLKLSGKLPQNLSGSLSHLLNYFKLEKEIQGSAHEARYDALGTLLVLQKLIDC